MPRLRLRIYEYDTEHIKIISSNQMVCSKKSKPRHWLFKTKVLNMENFCLDFFFHRRPAVCKAGSNPPVQPQSWGFPNSNTLKRRILKGLELCLISNTGFYIGFYDWNIEALKVSVLCGFRCVNCWNALFRGVSVYCFCWLKYKFVG